MKADGPSQLKDFVWFRFQTPLTLGLLILNLLAAGIFLLSADLRRSWAHEETVEIATMTVEKAVQAKDFDLAFHYLQLLSESHGLYSIEVHNLSGEQLMGPIGKVRLGLGNNCLQRNSSSGFVLKACDRRLGENEIFFFGLLSLIMAVMSWGLRLLWKSMVQSTLKLITDEIFSIESLVQKNQNSLYSSETPTLRLEELSRIRNRLKLLVERVQALTRHKVYSDFARRLSHDIRSPLGSLKMIRTSLRDIEGARDLQPLFDAVIEKIQKMLDQLQQEHEGVKVYSYSFHGLVDRLIGEFQLQFPEVSIQHFTGVPAFVTSPLAPLKLERGLSNLFHNSIEAHSSRIELKSNIESPSLLCLEIEDDGEGVDLSNMGRVGELGFTTKESFGSGLGVSGLKADLQKIGGDLQISTKVKARGFIVNLRIPLVVEESKQCA